MVSDSAAQGMAEPLILAGVARELDVVLQRLRCVLALTAG
jgi:hypothetical protein